MCSFFSTLLFPPNIVPSKILCVHFGYSKDFQTHLHCYGTLSLTQKETLGRSRRTGVVEIRLSKGQDNWVWSLSVRDVLNTYWQKVLNDEVKTSRNRTYLSYNLAKLKKTFLLDNYEWSGRCKVHTI